MIVSLSFYNFNRPSDRSLGYHKNTLSVEQHIELWPAVPSSAHVSTVLFLQPLPQLQSKTSPVYQPYFRARLLLERELVGRSSKLTG